MKLIYEGIRGVGMMIGLRRSAGDLSFSAHDTYIEKKRLCSSKVSLVESFLLMIAKRKQRAVLRRLDENLLRDIGKSREEAEKEANRYFWQ